MSASTHDVRTSIWGPLGWALFHGAALSAPDTLDDATRDRLRDFYAAFGKGMPCTDCRAHYAQHYPADGPPLQDRAALVFWTIDVHNGVNRSLRKPALTTEAALQHWTNVFGRAFNVRGFEHVQPRTLRPFAMAAGVLAVVAAVVLVRGRRGAP